MSAKRPHLLLVEALFYEHIATDLRRGAERDLLDRICGLDRQFAAALRPRAAPQAAQPAEIGDDPCEHGPKLEACSHLRQPVSRAGFRAVSGPRFRHDRRDAVFYRQST